MKKFLTDFMTENRDMSEAEQHLVRSEWETLLVRIDSALGQRPFRPSGRALNVAFYDSFCAALSQKITSGKNITDAEIKGVYEKLLADEGFLKLISSGTAADDAVRNRFETARLAFS